MEKSNDVLPLSQIEWFEPTPNFRWKITYEGEDTTTSQIRETKTLEQAWTSNKGNVRWQKVPEFYDV